MGLCMRLRLGNGVSHDVYNRSLLFLNSGILSKLLQLPHENGEKSACGLETQFSQQSACLVCTQPWVPSQYHKDWV